jgi:hypothetical protein
VKNVHLSKRVVIRLEIANLLALQISARKTKSKEKMVSVSNAEEELKHLQTEKAVKMLKDAQIKNS